MASFELKQEHLTLLAAANWRWEDCEAGAPSVDCKRPYGNSGDVADILGVKQEKCPHCKEPLVELDRAAGSIGG